VAPPRVLLVVEPEQLVADEARADGALALLRLRLRVRGYLYPYPCP